MTFDESNANYFLTTLDTIFAEVASYRATSTASSSSIGGWDSNDDEEDNESSDGYSTSVKSSDYWFTNWLQFTNKGANYVC